MNTLEDFLRAGAAEAHGSPPASVSALSNEQKERLRAFWRTTASVLAAALAVGSAALFFLPFLTFHLDQTAYTLSLFQAATAFFRVNGTAVFMPPAAKIAAALTPLLFLSGGALALFRKTRPAAACLLLGALAPLAVMMAGNSVNKVFLDLGVSTIRTDYHFPLAVMLLAGTAAALLVLSLQGGEHMAESILQVFASLSVGVVFIICVYMIAAGVPALTEIGVGSFLFGTTWSPGDGQYGILYMILASVLGTLGAILIGVPVGLLTAVFLAEMAPPRLAKLVRPAVELLAGIPSVIYGFFGMIVIVPAIGAIFPHSFGDSLLAMILILSIMVLPTIINVSETSLRAVPDAYREASLALGSTRIGTIFKVLVPSAKSGILSGVILGVGRAIGETMAVIMVCGNVVQFPQLLRSVRPLTAGVVLEMSYSYGLHRQALFSIGLVLFFFIMIVNITFTLVTRKGGHAHERR